MLGRFVTLQKLSQSNTLICLEFFKALIKLPDEVKLADVIKP